MTQQHFSMGAVVSGKLKVTIEGIGSYGAIFPSSSLRTYAGNVYVVLTGKNLFDDGEFFELISFDPEEKELVVKIKTKTQ